MKALASITLVFACAQAYALPENPVKVRIASDSGSFGRYTLYQDIRFRVTTSFSFTVRPLDGSYLTFRLGEDLVQARCPEPEEPARTFDCIYTVSPGDSDTDGISVPSNSLATATIARGGSRINHLGRDDKLHPALSDDAEHKVSADFCSGPSEQAGGILDGSDLSDAISLGVVFGLGEVFRTDDLVRISVSNADNAHKATGATDRRPALDAPQ